MLKQIHNKLPAALQLIATEAYSSIVVSNDNPKREIRHGFIHDYFDSVEEFRSYAEEVDDNPLIRDGLDDLSMLYGEGQTVGALPSIYGRAFYALVRKRKPETLVETGVCNGKSTLFVLAALSKNGSGTLHSIDYPFYTDESLAEFREETYEGFGGAAVPADKEPGWIIPEELHKHWNLQIGKSQSLLPELATELDGVDMFFHDSEHSVPCMLMEMELGREMLSAEGVFLVDDIQWNDAFETFVDGRDCSHGTISGRIGYFSN